MNPVRYQSGDTICAPATAAGIGAIAVIRVSGGDALQMVNSIFKGHDLTKAASHTVHFGKIMDGDTVLDEVLATLFVAPRSYTGEHVVELSCHGSPYIQQKILELLVRGGARLAQPGEFTLRAFLNKKLDLSQAEAVADLIASDSDAALQTALQQMRGGYSQYIRQMREDLIHFASLIELELDFSEEDVEFASRPKLIQLTGNIQTLLNSLIESFRYGNAIKNGVPTVIAGKPNAGKSTLLNALLKEERAIVSEIAGTTRDTIEERFVVDGVVFRLIDTAGIRAHTADTIEEKGISRTYEKMRQAEIIIYLFDAVNTSAAQLQAELQQLEKNDAKLILVGNKIDQDNQADHKTKFSSLGQPVIFISSLEGTGIDELLNSLRQTIFMGDAGNGQVVISNLRHYEALTHANESLAKVHEALQHPISGELLAFDIRKAIYHLGEITGDITTDDLLDSIFSKFCIGK